MRSSAFSEWTERSDRLNISVASHYIIHVSSPVDVQYFPDQKHSASNQARVTQPLIIAIMLEAFLDFLLGHWLFLLFLLVVAYFARLRYQKGLTRFPGPFTSSFTDLPRFLSSYFNYGRPPLVHLHKKYGEVVRIGPNTLSFNHPDAIRDIYGPGKNFVKPAQYSVFVAVTHGRPTPTLFSTIDKRYHDSVRRCISQAFSMTSLISYERFVDQSIEMFMSQLRERFADRASQEGVVDLSRWLHFYALDVITEITYGAPLGFLERGTDMNGLIKGVQSFIEYAGPVRLLHASLHTLLIQPLVRPNAMAW